MNTKRSRLLPAVALGGAALLGLSATVAFANHDTPPAAVPQVANAVPQLGQSDATEHRVDQSATGPDSATRELCQGGAGWLRPHFATLNLKGGDTITVSSKSTVDSFTLTSDHGTDRSLSTKSFAGDCVTITTKLADPASRYRIDSVQSGTMAADVIVAGAGDLCGSNCTQTAKLVKAANPAAVFTAGDNAYDSGTLSEYRNKYDPAWGQFKSITKPSPGNHEYNTSNASGYFDYFNGTGNPTGPAGDRTKGYYSWDVGDWHFVALNSNKDMKAGSDQEKWLRTDLKASTKPCTAAYWHHPLFTRGSHSNSTNTRPLWQALSDHKADLILVGHDHNYQRYAPQRPDGTADAANGIRQVLVGTGGQGLYNFTRTMPNVEASDSKSYGILKLALSSTGYNADFVPAEGYKFTDKFSGSCKAKGTGTPGQEVFSDDFETDKGWQVNASGTDTATTGQWERGNPEQTDDVGVKQLGDAVSGNNCLVTGPLAGASAGAHDVDGGRTSVRSPEITLPAGTLDLSFQWSAGLGDNATTVDSLKVSVVGSETKVVLDQRGNGAQQNASWRTATADLSAFAGQSVRIVVEATDADTGSLVEAQLDDLKITKR